MVARSALLHPFIRWLGDRGLVWFWVGYLGTTLSVPAYCAGFSGRPQELTPRDLEVGVSESDRYLSLLGKVSYALRLQKKAASDARSTSIGKAFRNLQVGDAWIVGIERLRAQGMKPHSDERKTVSFEQAKKDLALFRYEVKLRNEDESMEIELRPLSDPGAGISTEQLDGHIASILLRVDREGRQVSKTYRYQAGVPSQVQEVSVSPQGLRSKLSLFELFPLDWPTLVHPVMIEENRALLETLRLSSGGAYPEVPDALQELLYRSAFVKNEGRVTPLPLSRKTDRFRVVQGTDFFGRPLDVVWDERFAWPIWMRTTHGVAVLLQVISKNHSG